MADDAAAGQAGTSATLEAAHRGLLARGDIQFDFKPIDPPPAPAHVPGWLKWLANLLGAVADAIGPIVQVLFWGLVVLAVLGVVALIVREVGGFDFILRKKAVKAPSAQYHPRAEVALELLADADDLAAQGRFAEAVHVLLLRSIEDIDRWRPRVVRPSLTSRDIEGLDVLPGDARRSFAAMARLVEHSLFGGRPVTAEGFEQSRRAYEAFAFPQAWA